MNVISPLTMPEWPGEPHQSAEKVLADSSRLCIECGLCCTGAYLSWAPVTDDEITAYSHTAIRPYRDPDVADSEDPLRMVLSCSCHVNGLCSIFPNRPGVCGSYRCDLLKATMNGSVDVEHAMQSTATIKAQFEWLKSAAEKLGYFSVDRPSLDLVMREFYHHMKRRMPFAPAYAHEAEFARNSFEYLRNVDRHLARSRYLPRLGDIVGSLDRPRPGFDVPEIDIRRLRVSAAHALELRGCPELVEPLTTIIKGWDFDEIQPGDETVGIAMRVWKAADRYYWDMPFPGPCCDTNEPLANPIDVLHEIHYYIDDLYTLDNPTHFFLHAAAVEINGGGIVLLLGTHKTGKTTLSMALAARGHRLLADDRIAIDCRNGQAMAMGSVPLLRKPFPPDEGFWPAKSLIRKYRGIEDDSFAYVSLPDQLFAPKGYSGPVVAIVALNRSTTPTATAMTPISRADAVRVVVEQHYGKRLLPSEIFGGIQQLVAGAQTCSLKFARTKTALRDIEGLFGLETRGAA